MTPRDLIIRHESIKLKPYYDTATPPRLTIGCGRNLSNVGISMDEALYMLDADMAKVHVACDNYPWFKKLSDAREAAMMDLVFNLGYAGIAKFPKFLTAMSVGNWNDAANELVNSAWYNQVGVRGPEIVALIRTETWPI
jgi:lysozyme